MKVRKDFGKRMTALAEDISRETVADLLTRLAPPVEVSTRPPKAAEIKAGMDLLAAPKPIDVRGLLEEHARLGEVPPVPRARPRRRSPKQSDRHYEVLASGAPLWHRNGTWTRVMVKCVCNAPPSGWSTLEAEKRLRAEYPQYNHKMIDWHWLSEIKGYIKF